MTKTIVTTSINGPTEAIQKFAAMEGWQLVDVLDKKSPEERGGDKLMNAIYLSCEDQEKIDPKLSELIGWNCIQRRNFGFIYAIKELKSDIVATVDDDNIPMDGWGTNLLVGKPVDAFEIVTKQPAFDPLEFLTDSSRKIWHRGFPLQQLFERGQSHSTMGSITPDFQADFWNGDPDIDAICWMEHRPRRTHLPPYKFPFFSRTPSPFNSQNTFFTSAAAPHYFMMPGVGRMDDLWASFHAQAMGLKVIYNKPSVVQDRGERNYTRDMLLEFSGYEKNDTIIRDIPVSQKAVLKHLPERSLAAFRQYQTHFE